jgi:hypothetical protein
MKSKDLKRVVEELNSSDEKAILSMINVSINDADLGQKLKLIKTKIDTRNELVDQVDEDS